MRKAGDKVRITAQLIKAADGFHVWSDIFTRDPKAADAWAEMALNYVQLARFGGLPAAEGMR